MNDEKDKKDLNGSEDRQEQGPDKKYSYLVFKIITFFFIIVAMGMCSIKFMS